jgi:hypothetical protein
VTNAQARYALVETPSPVNHGKTLLDDVTNAITAAGGADATAWEYANVFSRNSTLVARRLKSRPVRQPKWTLFSSRLRQ